MARGLAYLLPNETIAKMDKFEGGYSRKEIALEYKGEEFKGIAYIQDSNDSEWHYPSRKYLVAIAKTLTQYFRIKKIHKEHIEIVVIESKSGLQKGSETIKQEEIEASHKD